MLNRGFSFQFISTVACLVTVFAMDASANPKTESAATVTIKRPGKKSGSAINVNAQTNDSGGGGGGSGGGSSSGTSSSGNCVGPNCIAVNGPIPTPTPPPPAVDANGCVPGSYVTLPFVEGMHYPNQTCAQTANDFDTKVKNGPMFHLSNKCQLAGKDYAYQDAERSCQNTPIPGFSNGSVYKAKPVCCVRYNSTACSLKKVIKFGADITSNNKFGDITATYNYPNASSRQTEMSKAVAQYWPNMPNGEEPTASLSRLAASQNSTFNNAVYRQQNPNAWQNVEGFNINVAPFHGYQIYGVAAENSHYLEFADNLVPDSRKICDVKVRTRLVGRGQIDTDGMCFFVAPKKLSGYSTVDPSSWVLNSSSQVEKVCIGVRDYLPACFYSSAKCKKTNGEFFPDNQQAMAKQPYFEFSMGHLPNGIENGNMTYTDRLMRQIQYHNNLLFYIQDDTTAHGTEFEITYSP